MNCIINENVDHLFIITVHATWTYVWNGKTRLISFWEIVDLFHLHDLSSSNENSFLAVVLYEVLLYTHSHADQALKTDQSDQWCLQSIVCTLNMHSDHDSCKSFLVHFQLDYVNKTWHHVEHSVCHFHWMVCYNFKHRCPWKCKKYFTDISKSS